MGGSQPSLSGNDALSKAFFPGPQARKLHRLSSPRANAKSTLFHWGRPFLTTLLQQFQHPVPSTQFQQHCPASWGRGISSHPRLTFKQRPRDEYFIIVFTVYPHEWKELASASATWAQRTSAQTSKRLPWGRAQLCGWMEGGGAGWREGWRRRN